MVSPWGRGIAWGVQFVPRDAGAVSGFAARCVVVSVRVLVRDVFVVRDERLFVFNVFSVVWSWFFPRCGRLVFRMMVIVP